MHLNTMLHEMHRAADPTLAVQMKHYMKDRFEFLGIKSPERRQISKSYVRAPMASWDEEQGELNQLWDAQEREFQYVGMDRFLRIKKLYSAASMQFVEFLITEKSWWDTVDYLASNVVYQHLVKQPEFLETYVRTWIDADDIWLNRSAMIWQLKAKDKVDTQFLAAAIVPHLNSKEFFIQKAIGWSLRLYSKFNPVWVRNFIAEYNITGLALREASKYL